RSHSTRITYTTLFRSSTERSEQSVAGSFEVMNESLEGFSETEWGVELAAIEDLNGELNKALKGDEISEEEAQKIASDYLQLEQRSEEHTLNSSHVSIS